METKQFEFGENSDFIQWLKENKDVESLILKGLIPLRVANELSEAILDSNITRVNVLDCEIDCEFSVAIPEDESYLDILMSEYEWDGCLYPVIVKLICNKSYAQTFLIENHCVLSDDKKVLIHMPDEKNITVANGVESIGISAFHGYKVQKVILPNSLKKISDRAFQWCESLNVIDIPDSVKELGKKSFSYGGDELHITLPKFLEEIPICCFRCTYLASMNMPPYLKAIRSGNALNFENTFDVVLPEGFESLEDDTFNIVDSIYLPSTVKEVAPDWYYEDIVGFCGDMIPKVWISPDNPNFDMFKKKLHPEHQIEQVRLAELPKKCEKWRKKLPKTR